MINYIILALLALTLIGCAPTVIPTPVTRSDVDDAFFRIVAGAAMARLADARLYLCTDARRDRGDLAEFADAALAGIQLNDRQKNVLVQFGTLEEKTDVGLINISQK